MPHDFDGLAELVGKPGCRPKPLRIAAHEGKNLISHCRAVAALGPPPRKILAESLDRRRAVGGRLAHLFQTSPNLARHISACALLHRTCEPRTGFVAGLRPGTWCTYSITSVARSRIDGGMARPSALAVLRFTAISNLVGNCTGRSPGFAPRRMRST